MERSNWSVVPLAGCVLVALTVASCSGRELNNTSAAPANSDGLGQLGLQLQPVSGVTLNQLHYTVVRGNIVVGEGDLPAPGTANSLAFALSLPVGTGYSVALSGAAVESSGITCTGTFGPFSIIGNASTNLTGMLECVDGSYGGIVPVGQVATDACPRLKVGYVAATPSPAPVGTAISLFSSANDLDDKPVTFMWSVANASYGTFSAPSAKDTSFTCTRSGENILLQVTADNGFCTKSLSTSVACHDDGTCGNGVVDPGETCDVALTPASCPADCTAVCGDGVAEAPAEDCDPPVFGSCSSTCKTISECGDGFKQPGEDCDDGNTNNDDLCSNTCHYVDNFEFCGDGIVFGRESCDPPFSENCGGDCKAISKSACQTCAAVNCAGAENCSGVPDSAACNKTLDCVRDSGCADGGFVLFCYCGAVSFTQCDAGGAVGACKAEIEAGLGSTDPIFIQNNLFDTEKSAGKAMARVDCELAAGCGLPCNK